MTGRARAAVIAAAAGVFAFGVFALVAQVFLEPAETDQTRVAQVLYLLNPVVTAILSGYLIVVRPRHPVGWLTGVIAVTATVDSLSKAALLAPAGSIALSVRMWGGWLDNWVWVLLFGAISLLVQTFPTGRLVGPRWRWVAAATCVAVAIEAVLCALVGRNFSAKEVPALVPALVPQSAAGAGIITIFATFGLSVLTLAVRRRRYRRTGDIVGTAQIRWLLWAGGVVLCVLIVGSVVDNTAPNSVAGNVADVLSQIAFYGFPLAIGVAITRHGLFEIDRVVSRTVSYLLVTGLLLGGYVGLIAGLSAFLPSNANSVVVAAATLVVAAAFVPVRRAVQARVDRRFNRRRLDRAVLVERFAEQLRREVAHGADGAALLAVVQRALEPTHAGLWLVRS